MDDRLILSPSPIYTYMEEINLLKHFLESKVTISSTGYREWQLIYMQTITPESLVLVLIVPERLGLSRSFD